MPPRARVQMTAAGVAEVHARAEEYAWELSADIEGDMKTYVPLLTGDLRSTIRRIRIAGGARIFAGGVAESGKIVDYHLYVEYGTSRMAAQPYIRPAVYQWRGV